MCSSSTAENYTVTNTTLPRPATFVIIVNLLYNDGQRKLPVIFSKLIKISKLIVEILKRNHHLYNAQ